MGLVLIIMLFFSMVALGIVERRLRRKKFEASRKQLQQLEERVADKPEKPVRLSRNAS